MYAVFTLHYVRRIGVYLCILQHSRGAEYKRSETQMSNIIKTLKASHNR